MDACYQSVKSKKWEPVQLEVWRGKEGTGKQVNYKDYDQDYYLIKEEKLNDGRQKLILKHKSTGEITQKVKETI